MRWEWTRKWVWCTENAHCGGNLHESACTQCKIPTLTSELIKNKWYFSYLKHRGEERTCILCSPVKETTSVEEYPDAKPLNEFFSESLWEHKTPFSPLSECHTHYILIITEIISQCWRSCNLKEKYSAIALFSVLRSLTLLLPMDQFLRIDVIAFNARFLLTETMYISSR